ncbi:MAG TPA: hypothetical protein VD903_11970 [Pseudonocardia sp.]|nr:hypothetical protein [Pseudonocardia sp.]
MTITFVGVGTAATAVNAGVTPGVPAGVAVGDLVLIHAGARSSGASVVLPSGWAHVGSGTGQRVIGRFWQTGDAMPLVTFTGTVAGDDTIAQACALRGVAPGTLTGLRYIESSQSNVSAQNIAYPAADVDHDGRALIIAAWKQDDASSVANPTGFSAIATTSSTAGNDMLLTWKYAIQTTAADLAAGSMTVTGGVAALSSAVVIGLSPAAALTVDEQDVWPPRNLITLSGLDVGDDVELYRVVGGERTLVRAGAVEDHDATAFLRVDAELPFGVPVQYLAVVNGEDEYTSAAVTYQLPGGKVALTDAVTGLAAEVVIGAWPSRRRERQADRFNVGGRTVIVSGDVGGFTGQLELILETWAGVEQVLATVAGATEGVLQLRQPGGYNGVDCYVSVTAVDEQRWSQDGTDDRRRIVLDVTEVEAWAPELEATGFTLQDIADAYDGQTLQDIADDYATLLALAQGEFGS